MPESTVANSILGVLDRVAGARGRREADGANVAQTQGQMLLNESNQRKLDDELDRKDFAEAYGAGFIGLDEEGNYSVTPEQAERWVKEAPDLLTRFSGREANPFFSTKGPNGNEDITYDGIEELPSAPQAPTPTLSGIPLQKPQAPQPKMFGIKLRKGDGSVVPATAGATASPDDTVIALSAEDIAKKLSRQVTRKHAAGAGGDAATLQSLKMDMHKAITANMQSAAIKAGPSEGVPADGQRAELDMIDDLEGDDLKAYLLDKGLDPEKLEADARKKWFDSQKKERTQAQLDYAKATDDLTAYENTKTILTNQVGRLDKALADYDKTQLSAVDSVDAESIRSGYPTIKSWGGGSPIARPAASSRNSKDPNNRTGKGGMSPRDEIVAERDAAVKQLAGLKQPKRPKMQSAMPATKFAWTDENLRASVAGTLPDSAPTAEQTAAVTNYAKEQGVTSAQDLKKLPREDAQALAWVISHNSPGTEKEKLDIFTSLSNFARTGDVAKSPIDAEVEINKALNDTQNANTNALNANTNVENAITNRMRVDYDQKNDDRDYSLSLQKIGYDRVKDLDAAMEKMSKHISTIRKGAMAADPDNPQSGDLVIKDTGPTAEMNAAMSEIRGAMMDNPVGSPMQIAATKKYLDGLSIYAASVAAKTGAPAIWDRWKALQNFFYFEGAAVPVNSMVENIQFGGYTNGVPSTFTILENGPGSRATEVMAGADTIDRLLGAGTFKDLEYASTSQAAVNRLQAEGQQVDESTLPAMIATIRKENGAK